MVRKVAFTAISLVVLLSLSLVTSSSHHRSKRFLFIHPESTFYLSLLLNSPVSLLLPTLVDTEGDGEEESYYSRSLREDSFQNRITDHQYPEDFTWEPSYEEELGRLQVYFTHLKVLSVQCQERLVCEMASNPDAYSPLSELILREIKRTHGPVKPSQDSLFWRFLASAATGIAYSEEGCAEYYGQCPTSAKEMINMSRLKILRFFTSNINLKLL